MSEAMSREEGELHPWVEGERRELAGRLRAADQGGEVLV